MKNKVKAKVWLSCYMCTSDGIISYDIIFIWLGILLLTFLAN